MRKALVILSLGLFFLVQAGGICWSQTTERVSVDSVGGNSDGVSNSPSLSSDGRYVAFQSEATDLVASDTNNRVDIFVRDRLGGTTLVSVDSAGNQATEASVNPSISADGRYVAFESDSDNLVVGDNNTFRDVFVRNLETGTTTIRVSVDSDGNESDDPSKNPSISADGKYVAFESGGELDPTATEVLFLFDVFVHDRDTDGDGIYDETGAVSTVRVSEDSDRNEADGISSYPSISADGRYVAFMSEATNLVLNDTNGWSDIFVRDRDVDGDGKYDEVGAISTVRVSVASGGDQGDGDSFAPSISADGRYVAFMSEATNLVLNDTNGWSDIFVRDLQTGVTTRVSVDSSGNQGNGNSNFPSISGDGNYVAFESEAKLVADDNGIFSDIFVYEGDPLPSNPTQSQGNNSSGSGSCFIATAASDWADF